MQIINKAARQDKIARVQAYMNVIAQANYNAIEEAINMSNAAKSLDEVFERTGLAARWEAKAEERKALDIAHNMFNQGYSIEAIISVTNLDPEKLMALFEPV